MQGLGLLRFRLFGRATRQQRREQGVTPGRVGSAPEGFLSTKAQPEPMGEIPRKVNAGQLCVVIPFFSASSVSAASAESDCAVTARTTRSVMICRSCCT